MKILYLGPENKNVMNFLQTDGQLIRHIETKLLEHDIKDIDYIISYGYRYIIDRNIVKKFRYKAINLHISYLPWNRGADPNLWSFLENTPKGVTIHYIDDGLDTGEILAQVQVGYTKEATLRTTYQKLKLSIENLFYQQWENIKNGTISIKKQMNEEGSYHKRFEKDKYKHLLLEELDTKVVDILGKY